MPETPLSFEARGLPSNTPIPRLTPLTTPTASGSNQPFCHSILSGHTDTYKPYGHYTQW